MGDRKAPTPRPEVSGLTGHPIPDTYNVRTKEHLALLGRIARDKITGFSGVIASVSFDLYGCVQVSITPEYRPNDKAEIPYGHWFDFRRVEADLTKPPVMRIPDYDLLLDEERDAGPAEKARK